MSTYNYQKAGVGHVGSYQTSGIPFVVTGDANPVSSPTTTVIQFPKVTKFIVIKNTGSDGLRVGFSENGILNSGNYFVLSNNESFSADLRMTDLHLLSNNSSPCEFTLVAGLTAIDRSELPNNWSGSAGVG